MNLWVSENFQSHQSNLRPKSNLKAFSYLNRKLDKRRRLITLSGRRILQITVSPAFPENCDSDFSSAFILKRHTPRWRHRSISQVVKLPVHPYQRSTLPRSHKASFQSNSTHLSANSYQSWASRFPSALTCRKVVDLRNEKQRSIN